MDLENVWSNLQGKNDLVKRSEGTKSTPYTERMNLLRESLKDRSEKRLVSRTSNYDRTIEIKRR